MADIVTVQTIADVAGVKHVAKMTNLSDGTGEWVIDPDARILTFHEYADVSSYVNSTDKLPYLSFYRYAGETGSSNLFTESTDFSGCSTISLKSSDEKYFSKSIPFILKEPLPGFMYNLATEVFLLPTVLIYSILNLYFFRFLTFMGMFRIFVNK